MGLDTPRREETRRLLDSIAVAPIRAEPPPRARPSLRWLYGAGAIALLLVVTVLLLWLWPGRRTDGAPARASAQVSAPAGAAPAGRSTLQASGFVVARRQATVSADVTGRVVELHVNEGTQVEEGQLLAELDSRIAVAQLGVARSSIESERRTAEVTRSRIADAQQRLQRSRELAVDGFVSKAELDAAVNELSLLEAQLASDLSRVGTARKQYELQRQQLEATRIVAPFAGAVTELAAHVGEIVSPISAGGGFTRTGICTIVDLDSVEGEADISEQYLGRVHRGQDVGIVAAAYPGERFHGTVAAITPVVERNTAAIKVRVRLDNSDGRLMPGMRIDMDFADEVARQPTPGSGDTGAGMALNQPPGG